MYYQGLWIQPNGGTNPNKAIRPVRQIIGKFLGYIQVFTAVLTVIIVASTGFKYIVETPDVKKDILKTMLPMIVGIIFVFCTTSIAKFFIGLFSNGNI